MKSEGHSSKKGEKRGDGKEKKRGKGEGGGVPGTWGGGGKKRFLS